MHGTVFNRGRLIADCGEGKAEPMIIFSGRIIYALVIAGFFLVPVSGHAEQAQSFDAWLVQFKKEAREKGISQATLEAAFHDVQPIK